MQVDPEFAAGAMESSGRARANSRSGASEVRILTSGPPCMRKKAGPELRPRVERLSSRFPPVPEVCPRLPSEVREALTRTRYAKMANAALALATPPKTPYAGYAFTPDVVPRAEIEMEHLRAPNRGPSGTEMAGVFLWNTPGNCVLPRLHSRWCCAALPSPASTVICAQPIAARDLRDR